MEEAQRRTDASKTERGHVVHLLPRVGPDASVGIVLVDVLVNGSREIAPMR